MQIKTQIIQIIFINKSKTNNKQVIFEYGQYSIIIITKK